MTRDPHCDGCKADDNLRALRAEVAALTAERDAARAELEHARATLRAGWLAAYDAVVAGSPETTP